MRAVWVVEWVHPDGRVFPMDAKTHRHDAWKSMHEKRAKWPEDGQRIRTVKYVPAPTKKPAKKRATRAGGKP